MSTTALLRTPFHAFHLGRGARMVPFAGWDMPLHYGSIIEEHRAVRTAGGIFDVSHMGRLRFSGRDARAFLDLVCTRQILGMEDGQARYTLICNERGGCRDDALVYRIAEHEYLMVCNAANRSKLLEHFAAVRGGAVFELEDETEATAMVALQGPAVMPLIGGFSSAIPALKRYRFAVRHVLFAKLLIARTGYTGEDGVEVILPARSAGRFVDLLLGQVSGRGGPAIVPVGLGARDSLRLEAGMPLYGHELDEDTDALASGLSFAIRLDKGAQDPQAGRFIGQDALQEIEAAGGPRRRLVGLALEGRRAARQGMSVRHGGAEIGTVTSGMLSPTLDRSIAMAYVESAHADIGRDVEIDLGRATAPARVVKMPFYER